MKRWRNCYWGPSGRSLLEERKEPAWLKPCPRWAAESWEEVWWVALQSNSIPFSLGLRSPGRSPPYRLLWVSRSLQMAKTLLTSTANHFNFHFLLTKVKKKRFFLEGESFVFQVVSSENPTMVCDIIFPDILIKTEFRLGHTASAVLRGACV